MSRQVSIVLVTSDDSGCDVMDAVRQVGLCSAGDVVIIGFDTVTATKLSDPPSPTSILEFPGHMGLTPAEMLLDMVTSKSM